MRSCEWGPHDGINAPMRRDTRQLAVLLCCVRTVRRTICKPGRQPSPEAELASTDFGPLSFQNCERKKFCCLGHLDYDNFLSNLHRQRYQSMSETFHWIRVFLTALEERALTSLTESPPLGDSTDSHILGGSTQEEATSLATPGSPSRTTQWNIGFYAIFQILD